MSAKWVHRVGVAAILTEGLARRTHRLGQQCQHRVTFDPDCARPDPVCAQCFVRYTTANGPGGQASCVRNLGDGQQGGQPVGVMCSLLLRPGVLAMRRR